MKKIKKRSRSQLFLFLLFNRLSNLIAENCPNVYKNGYKWL